MGQIIFTKIFFSVSSIFLVFFSTVNLKAQDTLNSSSFRMITEFFFGE